MCWNSLSFKFKRIRNGNQKYLKKLHGMPRHRLYSLSEGIKRIKLETLKKAEFCYCTRYI